MHFQKIFMLWVVTQSDGGFFFFFSPVWGKVSVFSSYLPESVLLSDLVAPVTRKARGFHEQPPWMPCRAGSGEQKVNQCL